MKAGLKFGLYGLLFLATLGVTAYLTLVFLIQGQPEVDVPNLTGLDAVTALKAVSDQGLNLKVRAMDHSPTVPKDHVISQDPPPASKIKRGREVKVVLSRGRATVALPDLRGLSLDQATAILGQSRLQTRLTSYTFGSGPEQGRDRILAQAPEPLTEVQVGAKVDLLVSLGPAPVYLAMPDLTGEPYTAALAILNRAGISLGRLETEILASWPADTVVVQDPAPGTRVAQGSLVHLTVNRTEAAEPEEYTYRLLRYQLPYGLFRREIRFRVAVGAYLLDLYHAWHQPGEEVQIMALVRGAPRGQVFDDHEEKKWQTSPFGP